MSTTADTRDGRIRGVAGDGVLAFRGVRYGTAERFRPAAPPAPWTGVVPADAFGPSSPPTLTAEDRAFFPRSPLWRDYAGLDPAIPFDEDCLYLNVWTPSLSGRRPVLVWLHGGGFSWGSGSSRWTRGDRLAARQDIVVVTLNHRLGVLGYLHLEDVLGPEWAGSGIGGLLDIRLALEWIRDNAAAFGGDPANVTIVGHSGGGAKVAALLALPSARGLFRRAVIQSGVVSLRTVDRDEANATAVSLLSDAGGADRLLELSASDLTRLAAPYRFRPVARTPLLPQHPFDPVAAPSAAGVPLLIGTTADDAATFKFDSDPRFPELDEADLTAWVAFHRATDWGELADEVIARVRTDGASPVDVLVAAATLRLRERTDALLRRKTAEDDTPAYLYRFTYAAEMPQDTIFAGRRMSSHGIEIPFVFDIADRIPIAGTAQSRPALAGLMSGCWASFARSGDPGWPAWEPVRQPTMVFDKSSGAVDLPEPAEQALFDRLRAHEAAQAPGSTVRTNP